MRRTTHAPPLFFMDRDTILPLYLSSPLALCHIFIPAQSIAPAAPLLVHQIPFDLLRGGFFKFGILDRHTSDLLVYGEMFVHLMDFSFQNFPDKLARDLDPLPLSMIDKLLRIRDNEHGDMFVAL